MLQLRWRSPSKLQQMSGTNKIYYVKNEYKNIKTTEEFIDNVVKSGISYSETTKAPAPEATTHNNEMNEFVQELRTVSEMCNLKQMILLIKEAKTRPKAWKSNAEKMIVVLKLCENLNEDYCPTINKK